MDKAELEGRKAGLKFVSSNETLINNPYTRPRYSVEDRAAWFKGHNVGRCQPLQYCIQCKDKASGAVGCFGHYGDFVAVTKVCRDLVAFFTYCTENNIRLDSTP